MQAKDLGRASQIVAKLDLIKKHRTAPVASAGVRLNDTGGTWVNLDPAEVAPIFLRQLDRQEAAFRREAAQISLILPPKGDA